MDLAADGVTVRLKVFVEASKLVKGQTIAVYAWLGNLLLQLEIEGSPDAFSAVDHYLDHGEVHPRALGYDPILGPPGIANDQGDRAQFSDLLFDDDGVADRATARYR